MLIAFSLERLSSEDGFSQQLTESNIAFALSIAGPLAENQHFLEELLNAFSSARRGRVRVESCPD